MTRRGGFLYTGAIATAIALGLGGAPPTPPSDPNWAGTFDCYGSTPNCTGLTAAGCTTTIAATNLQTTLNSASGGNVICVNTGSTGTITLSSKAYASDVIVQPASGAAVTVGAVDLDTVAHLHFTGVGGGGATMSLAGGEVDQTTGCSSNITFDHITYTDGQFIYPKYACSHGLSLLWDHDRFDNISGPGGGEEQRFRIVDTGGPTSANGITVSNNHFSGGCSDGIDFAGSPHGTIIGPGNEFTNIDQTYADANCGGTHIDPIQGLGTVNTVITGNWFHDNGSGSGGILSAGEDTLTVKNNVFASTGYSNSIVNKAPVFNENFQHNVFYRNVETEIGNGGETNGSGNVIRNNAFPSTGGILMPNGTSVTFTADHNAGLDLGAPVFVSSPATGYYHYQLDSSSPGYNAGTDGKSTSICATCG